MLSATVAIVGRSFTLSRNIAARLEGLIAYGATARISLFIEFANLDRGDEHPFVFVVFGVAVATFPECHRSCLTTCCINGPINPSTPMLLLVITFGWSAYVEVPLRRWTVLA
jgi:hypothetical protein